MGKKGLKKKGNLLRTTAAESSTTESAVARESSTATPTAVRELSAATPMVTTMAIKDFHELDPEGDVELVLPVPLEGCGKVLPAEDVVADPREAACHAKEVAPCEQDPPCNKDDLTCCKERPPCEETTLCEDSQAPAEDSAPVAEAEPTGTESEIMLDEEQIPTDNLGDGYIDISSETTPESPVDDLSPNNRAIRFLVSSHHLRLSSPTFRILLQQHNPSGVPHRRVSITLANDDPRALLTLLQILHHRTRDVPRELTLNSLAKFATLVDKYDCLEAVEPFSNVWIDKLKAGLPGTFSEKLRAWLHVAWVCGREVEFRHLTRMVELNSDGDGRAERDAEFPIAEEILDAIQPKRIEALTGLVTMFQNLIEQYQDASTRRCPREYSGCDPMVLGSLIRNGRSIRLLPPPQPPYQGLSFLGAAEMIRQLTWPTLCRRNGYDYDYDSQYEGANVCGVEFAVKREVEGLREGLKGLELGRLRGHKGEGRQ